MCGFTYKHYEEILDLAVNNCYNILNCEEYIKKKGNESDKSKVLVLRHDIDSLPKRALEFAKIEYRKGVHSTYFFRVFSNQYNIFDYNTLNIIYEIKKMGHEIGYHAEPVDVANAVNINVDKAYFMGKRALEIVLDSKILGVASHREATGFNNLTGYLQNKSLKELDAEYEAYDNSGLDLFNHSLYVTDGYEWYWRSYRNGKLTDSKECICEILRKDNEPTIYLLTHPNSWFKTHYHVW